MASTATAKPNIAAMPSPGDALAALREARRQTLALVSGLDAGAADERPLADHEPAGVGSRAYRGV